MVNLNMYIVVLVGPRKKDKENLYTLIYLRSYIHGVINVFGIV